MDIKAHIEFDGGEHLLVAGADGGAADQGGGVLRHEHGFATEHFEDGIDGVTVEGGLIGPQDGLDGHGLAPVVGTVGLDGLNAL